MLKTKTIEQMRIRLIEIRKELERIKGSIYSMKATISTIIDSGHWLSEYIDVTRYVSEIRDLQVEAVGLMEEQSSLATESKTAYDLEEMLFQLNCAREHLQETLELAAA
jgi:hypothetical protein